MNNLYAERFKTFRESKNLSQQEMADALNISRETVSVIENGHQEPSAKTKRALLEKFNYNISENIVEEDEAVYKRNIKITDKNLGKVIGIVFEKLIRIESHLEVYESAIAELQSDGKGDFMNKISGLRSAVKEVSDRRFSESEKIYG